MINPALQQAAAVAELAGLKQLFVRCDNERLHWFRKATELEERLNFARQHAMARINYLEQRLEDAIVERELSVKELAECKGK